MMSNTRPLDRRMSSVRRKRLPFVATGVRHHPLRSNPDPVSALGRPLRALDDVPRPPARITRRRRRALVARLQLFQTPTKDYLVLRLRGDVSVATVIDALRCTADPPLTETSWVLVSGTPGTLGGVAYPAACEALDRFLGRW